MDGDIIVAGLCKGLAVFFLSLTGVSDKGVWAILLFPFIIPLCLFNNIAQVESRFRNVFLIQIERIVPPPPLEKIGDLIYSPGTDLPFGKRVRIGLSEQTIYESAVDMVIVSEYVHIWHLLKTQVR